ncbi:glycosyltransferase [Phaeacidiphilus oryzae]|uniref:glycosyltransferase n=1 Tax=Phaeacidiphilus oryzae TaxID=348818 RepID=UPI00389A1E85
MRIALVSEHASPLAALGGPDAGGQNVYIAALAHRLAVRGHQVVVYTRRDDPAIPDEVPCEHGYTVSHVRAGPPRALVKDELLPHMPEFGERLGGLWRDAPPDVVHSHYWMSGLAALHAAGPYGVPVVHTYHALGSVKRRHQGSADTSPASRVQLETALGQRCRQVLATCADEVAELTELGVPADRVRVIPCGVDAEHFSPRPTPRQHTGGLLAVGRMVPRKGFDRAVRVLARLPGVELTIAGGPPAAELQNDPEAERLRKLAAEHGVADRVRLLGAVPHEEMPELMSQAALVLSTPVYEPFGIVPLEAMACGTPVVATAVGGQLDTVADGETGLLLPPETGDGELADAVGALLADPRRLAELGAAGRARVLDRFTWQQVAAQVDLAYREVARQPAASHPDGGIR